MDRLELLLEKMLNHVDDHKKAYSDWTNKDIAKAWVAANIVEVSKILHTENKIG